MAKQPDPPCDKKDCRNQQQSTNYCRQSGWQQTRAEKQTERNDAPKFGRSRQGIVLRLHAHELKTSACNPGIVLRRADPFLWRSLRYVKARAHLKTDVRDEFFKHYGNLVLVIRATDSPCVYRTAPPGQFPGRRATFSPSFCSDGCLCRVVFQGPSFVVPHQRLAFGDAFSDKLGDVNLPVSICGPNVNTEISWPRGSHSSGAWHPMTHGTQ